LISGNTYNPLAHNYEFPRSLISVINMDSPSEGRIEAEGEHLAEENIWV